MTENLPGRKRSGGQLDIVRIHSAVDDALSVLMAKSSREEEFDLKVEIALRTIREELEKLRKSQQEKP